MTASQSLVRRTCLLRPCVSRPAQRCVLGRRSITYLPDDEPLARIRHVTVNYQHEKSAEVDAAPGLRRSVIAFGSNLGDRLGNIENALRQFERHAIRIEGTSPLYESKAMYDTDQGPFLNGVLMAQSRLPPLKLLDALQGIENELGRVRDPDKPKGPRTLDLDILYCGHDVVHTPRLTLPHPGIEERPFVLQPLIEMRRHQKFRQYERSHIFRADHKTDFSTAWMNLTHKTQSEVSQVIPLARDLSMRINNTSPKYDTKLMSVLNITPDSFSDGGELADSATSEGLQAIVDRAKAHITDGASVLDIGGQSTRPGATILSAEEELARVLPALRAIKTIPEIQAGKISVSLDTFWSAVVSKCASEDLIDIINDISAGRHDKAMISTVAKTGKSVILMHSRGSIDQLHGPENTLRRTRYIPKLCSDLEEALDLARSHKIPEWRIMLDPGIGFSKATNVNYRLLVEGTRRLDDAMEGKQFWVVGTSRKSFMADAVDGKAAGERDWGTAAAVTGAVLGGAHVVRVHNTKAMADVVRVADKIREGKSLAQQKYDKIGERIRTIRVT